MSERNGVWKHKIQKKKIALVSILFTQELKEIAYQFPPNLRKTATHYVCNGSEESGTSRTTSLCQLSRKR